MTAILDRVPVERITREAKHAKPGRTVLAVIAGFLFSIGWLLARTAGLIWLAVAWCGTAVKVGYQEGRVSARRARAG